MDDRSQVMPTDTLVGRRYRVVRLLGRGGMGAVYEAEHTWTKARVALKVMRPELARDARYALRFMQEAQAVSKLKHPHVVSVLDMGEDEALGSLYIVQEFLTGRDLRAHLDARGPLAARDALTVITPVMEALVAAHAHGIVHRDLKPDNVFLAETPRGVVPTLIDFGIAKVVDEGGDSLQRTSTGVLMGTPYYMSPEQGRGDPNLDARTDVWSIAVVLYEMLSGKRPHDATTNANALIAKIIYEDPVDLARVAPHVPADVVRAVMGALQRDVTRRHATMQAFLDALRACGVTRESGTIAPRVTPVDPIARGSRDSHWLRLAGLVLAGALGLGLVAGALASSRRSARATRPVSVMSTHVTAVDASVAPVGPVALAAPQVAPTTEPEATPARTTPRPAAPRERARQHPRTRVPNLR